MEKIMIDTLIYIKETNSLCRYVAYSEVRKVHILYDVISNRYKDLIDSNLKNNYILDKDEMISLLKEKIDNAKLEIENIKKQDIDTIDMVDKLELLKYELNNLENVIIPTANQEMAIKNTKKAIKRQTDKIHKACREYDEKKRHKIYCLNDKIEDYKYIIDRIKKLNKGV